MLETGIEPATVGLLDQCSTDWATRAFYLTTLTAKQKNMFDRGQAGIEPATSRTLNENHTTRPLAHLLSDTISNVKKIFVAPTRARTGDLSVNSRPLCQLSHRSWFNWKYYAKSYCISVKNFRWKKKIVCADVRIRSRTPVQLQS